jgi:predicted DNA-binding protein (UPF0251 family)
MAAYALERVWNMGDESETAKEAVADELLQKEPVDSEYPTMSAGQEAWKRRREVTLAAALKVEAPPERGGIHPDEAAVEAAYQVLAAAALSREERACYLLSVSQEWSFPEIGRLFGFSQKTAWVRVQNAREKIARIQRLLKR